MKNYIEKNQNFFFQNCPLGSNQFSISIHDQILSFVPKCIIDLNHDFFPSLSLCVPSSLDISSFLDFKRENLIKDKEGILQRFLLLKAPQTVVPDGKRHEKKQEHPQFHAEMTQKIYLENEDPYLNISLH